MAIGMRYLKADGADAGLQQQDDEDLVGRVGRRGDRVGGEHRQGDDLAKALVRLVLRRDRLADEDSFQGWHGVRTHPTGVRSQPPELAGAARSDRVRSSCAPAGVPSTEVCVRPQKYGRGDLAARIESGAPPAMRPAEHLRVRPLPGRPGLTRKGADYGTASDRRRESRHDPGVGERQGRSRHRAPRRAGPHRPGEDHRARRLHRAPGHLRPQGREEAQQARGRPLRQGRRAARSTPRRAAPRRGRRLRGRPGDQGRPARSRASGSTSPPSAGARASPAA